MGRKNLQVHISWLLALLLAVSCLFTAAPTALAASGSCGEDVSWSLENGTLTISGSGAIDDYSRDDPAPWYGSRDAVQKLVLSEGLTRIGTWAFAECTNLMSVSMPSTMSHIAEAAFWGCSGMNTLSLNYGLRTIGESAFSQCRSLADLRIPDSLMNIEHHAFYMCSNLTYVNIPGSVTSFGSGVFCYCDSLLRVDVDAAVTLPGFTFYGCDNLQSVTLQGASVNTESLKVPNLPSGSGIIVTQPTSSTPRPIEPGTSPQNEVYVSAGNTTTNEDGSVVQNNTVVHSNEKSTTVSTTTTTQNGETTTIQKEITSTVVTPDGWNDVLQQVESTSGSNTGNANVTVYDVQGDIVSKQVLQDLAGKEVSLTVQNQNGTQFKVDCTKLPEKVKKDLVLNYNMIPLENVPEGMEGCTVYQLTFEKSADFQVEMIIRLPGNHSYQTATLYRMDKKGPIQLQSVMVDDQSNAHWYLRSIDHKQEYLIGINIPGATTESPIIPAELAGIHKVANVYDGVEYVVTGRSSSWNMGLGRVMLILAAVMVSAIVVIGFVMFSLNKRRLKNGYMPDWSEEDEE